MGVRYFCDGCGSEVPEEQVRILKLSLLPEAEVPLQVLCPACAVVLGKLLERIPPRALHEEVLRRAVEEPAPAGRRAGGVVASFRPLLRFAGYGAFALGIFFLVTWLASR